MYLIPGRVTTSTYESYQPASALKMIDKEIQQLLDQYSIALDALEEADSSITTIQAANVLAVRDAVYLSLAEQAYNSGRVLIATFSLDERLRKLAAQITQAVDLAAWRESRTPPPEAWWWNFDKRSVESRFEWLRIGIIIVCFTVCLALVTEISTRFLSGGPDIAASFAVILQSLIATLAIGGALTKQGRQVVEQLLGILKVPKNLWPAFQLGAVLVLVLAFGGLRLSLPTIAVWYNNRGVEYHKLGQLPHAQASYNRAIKLNPDYFEAHYNTGVVFEDLLDYSHARSEYRIAVEGGLDAAFNNLARLYNLDQDYGRAVPLLLSGLDLVMDNEVRYDLLKNLGWARLGQACTTCLIEADDYLRAAIDLNSERPPAHCLLAQVLEAQAGVTDALEEWEQCLKLANARNVDEDIWINMARERLSTRRDQ